MTQTAPAVRAERVEQRRRQLFTHSSWIIAPAIGIAMLATFLVSELRIASHAGFPIDDAWIHAVFARNLVEGQGFAFNPGESIGGSTAPLWSRLPKL